MAIRTTIVNKTKNEDGTYSEKELHPFTDMNAVVSLEAVPVGNYDAYTSLPLEGAPQNVLTAFLNTRSYLYSLRNFKNKTVTDNYTEDPLTTKVPSMKALNGAYNACKTMAINANANAETRIPKASITNDYNVSTPSETKVLSQTGASDLYTNLNSAKIDKASITSDYKTLDISETKVLSQTGASDLYVQSFLNNLTLTILNAPLRYVSPVYFNDMISPKAEHNYVVQTDNKTELCLRRTSINSGIKLPIVEFFKVSFFESDLDTDPNIYSKNLNNILRGGEYNINDLYRARYFDCQYIEGSGIVQQAARYYNNQIIDTSVALPDILEETIIVIVLKQFERPRIGFLYQNSFLPKKPISKTLDIVEDGNNRTVRLSLQTTTNMNYTVEYCDMKIDNTFAYLLFNHL